MTERELICIGCPMGCRLTVETENGAALSVRGNGCKHGEEYGIKETTAPARTVTGTVAVRGALLPVLPVRTAGEVPKSKVMDVAAAMHEILAEAPVSIGDVICEDVAGTGVALIATAVAE